MNRFVITSLIASVALAGSVTASTASTASAASTASSVVKVENAKNIKRGQFCKKADAGKSRRASNGDRVKCVKVGSRHRWK